MSSKELITYQDFLEAGNRMVEIADKYLQLKDSLSESDKELKSQLFVKYFDLLKRRCEYLINWKDRK